MRPNELDCVQPVRTFESPGLRLCEGAYPVEREIPAQPHEWATLCLTIEGGYQIDWRGDRVHCGPSALVFHPPGDVYGARILGSGTRCLTVAFDLPALGDTGRLAASGRLRVPWRAAPRWLAYQLRRELQLADDLSAISVENTVVALLSQLTERPGLQARTAPPWLRRVREQVDDEFRRQHTLQSLARTAGVHRVHLAREFHRRFGCTVGQYIRQRRIELACHRLTSSRESLSRIAFDTGFADQSHLTNTFRTLVGLTPGAFRKRFGNHAQRSSAGDDANLLQDVGTGGR